MIHVSKVLIVTAGRPAAPQVLWLLPPGCRGTVSCQRDERKRMKRHWNTAGVRCTCFSGRKRQMSWTVILTAEVRPTVLSFASDGLFRVEVFQNSQEGRAPMWPPRKPESPLQCKGDVSGRCLKEREGGGSGGRKQAGRPRLTRF